MDKKIVAIIIAVIVIIAVVAGIVASSKTKDIIEKDATQDPQQQFYFEQEGITKVELGSEFSREKYGQELEYSEIASCAFEGLDKTYRYEHYEITTFPEGEKDRVYSILFLDENVATTEGVKISDTYDDMVEKYSDNFEKEDNMYIYKKNKTQLQFIVENDVITSIEYVFDTEN